MAAPARAAEAPRAIDMTGLREPARRAPRNAPLFRSVVTIAAAARAVRGPEAHICFRSPASAGRALAVRRQCIIRALVLRCRRPGPSRVDKLHLVRALYLKTSPACGSPCAAVRGRNARPLPRLSHARPRWLPRRPARASRRATILTLSAAVISSPQGRPLRRTSQLAKPPACFGSSRSKSRGCGV